MKKNKVNLLIIGGLATTLTTSSIPTFMSHSSFFEANAAVNTSINSEENNVFKDNYTRYLLIEQQGKEIYEQRLAEEERIRQEELRIEQERLEQERLKAIEEENRLLDELINNSSNPNTTTNINVNEINVNPVVNPVPINPVPVGATESIVSTQIPLIEEQKIENPEIITFEDLEKEFNDII